MTHQYQRRQIVNITGMGKPAGIVRVHSMGPGPGRTICARQKTVPARHTHTFFRLKSKCTQLGNHNYIVDEDALEEGWDAI